MPSGRNRPLTPEERAHLSQAMKNSPAVAAARAAKRGVPRPPLSDETRAKMSASKLARPNTPEWDTLYAYYLKKLQDERELKQTLSNVCIDEYSMENGTT